MAGIGTSKRVSGLIASDDEEELDTEPEKTDPVAGEPDKEPEPDKTQRQSERTKRLNYDFSKSDDHDSDVYKPEHKEDSMCNNDKTTCLTTILRLRTRTT